MPICEVQVVRKKCGGVQDGPSSRQIRYRTSKSLIQVFACFTSAAPWLSGFYRISKKLFSVHQGLWWSGKPCCSCAWAHRLSHSHKRLWNISISCSEARGVNLFLHGEFTRIIPLLRVSIMRAWWSTKSHLSRGFRKEKKATRVTREYTVSTTTWAGQTTQRPWTQADRDRVDC